MDPEETLEPVEGQEQLDAFQEGFSEEDAPLEAETEDASAPESASEEAVPAAGEAEQEPEAAGAAGAEAPEEGQPPAEQQSPRTWTLDLDGQSVQVGEQDLIGLARKGAGYDSLSRAYEEARPMAELIAEFAGRAGLTPAQYMANLRTQMHQARGMSQEQARQAVELEDRERAVRAAEEQRQREQAQLQARQNREAALEARRQREVREFARVFPDAARNFKDMPPAVWQGVQQGLSLTAAYAMYQQGEAAKAAQAQEQAKQVAAQNAANAAKSAGSQRSAGDNFSGKDPFLEAFENG